MRYRHLLLARFLLINVVAVGLAAAGYLQGWLSPIIDAHLAELSGIIVLVFLYGLALAGLRIWQTSREINAVADGAPDPATDTGDYLRALGAGGGDAEMLAQVLRLKLSNRIVVVRHIAGSLVFLGLIGTVIGFIIALSGVDVQAASDAQRVGAMVATLINGMSVALNTTLVGSVLYVWLIVNHRVLAAGTVDLLTATLKHGAARPRAA